MKSLQQQTENALNASVFLGADTTKPAVRQVFGVSGSGKTCWMRELILRAQTSTAFGPKTRIVVFDVKHEGYGDLVELPVSNYSDFSKSIRENRVTVIHPTIQGADEMLDDVIAELFDLAETVEGFAATLVLEESSTFITTTVSGVPDSIKRMATQGRSRRLTLILLNQRALNAKWVDTQTSSMTLFRLPHPDIDLIKKRWGVDPIALDERLKNHKFSFAHYDLESLELQYYLPITLTPTRTEPQETAQERL